MHVKFRTAAAALAALVALSCGGVTSPSQNKQDTFPGVLKPGQAIPYKVTVSNGGEFSIKITQLQPNATAVVGTEWDFGDNCDVLVQRNPFSTLNTPALAGAVLQKGNYCALIYDSVGLANDVTFTMVVSHP